jgi:hypothetical protein
VNVIDGELREATIGKPIFANRAYVFHELLPEALRGRPFVFSVMEKAAVEITTPGVVHVLTPTPDRNHDSQTAALEKQGFVRTNIPEFLLFPNTNGDVSPANVVSVYQKKMAAGDRLEIGKWGVVLP